jgi:hypothetical protein
MLLVLLHLHLHLIGRSSRLASVMFVIAGFAVMGGCARRANSGEIVSVGDSRHVNEKAVIVLPRTCVVESEISARHLSSNRTQTTIDVRRVLDRSLLGSSAMIDVAPARANDTCENGNGHAIAMDLGSLYASAAALSEMRSRGAKRLLVIELRAAFGCIYGGGPALVAHYGSIGMGALTAETTANRCQEEDIALTAYLFDEDGHARWVATRNIEPGTTNIEPLIDGFLNKIPITIPGHRIPGEPIIRPCHLDDHSHADCT